MAYAYFVDMIVLDFFKRKIQDLLQKHEECRNFGSEADRKKEPIGPFIILYFYTSKTH